MIKLATLLFTVSTLLVVAQTSGDSTEAGESNGSESYLLSLGSFRETSDAQNHKSQLAETGYTTRIQYVIGEDANWYRVVIGPVAGARNANEMRKQLADNGFKSMKVALTQSFSDHYPYVVENCGKSWRSDPLVDVSEKDKSVGYDLEGARAAGLRDHEIATYLGCEHNFDLEKAIDEGYSLEEIIDNLVGLDEHKDTLASEVDDELVGSIRSNAQSSQAPSANSATSSSKPSTTRRPTTNSIGNISVWQILILLLLLSAIIALILHAKKDL